jgi:hypothetical protein
MRVFYFATLAVLAAIAARAENSINTQADAFNAGKAFANDAKDAAVGKVNGDTGSQQLPYYGTSAPEAAHFQGGRNLISANGTNKQNACQSYRASDAFQQQECDAVNFLSKTPATRPKYTIDKKTDPLLTGSKSVIDNPGPVPGAHTQRCRVEKVIHPATFITETCTESQTLENVKCRRGFSANVGTIVETPYFEVDHGVNVPPWTAQTYTMNFHVNGNPERLILTWYRVDNYGQLWINGTKVFENVLSGYGDMRWGSVGQELIGRGSRRQRRIVYKDRHGVSMGHFYDDGCNWGCLGVSPNLDITPHFKEGNNEIVLVCANANDIGPCTVKIVGSAKRLVMLGSLIDNQCATLEQRAQ